MGKAPRDVSFSCGCGTVQGIVRGASPSTGTHVACYCTDCRVAELYADQPDPLTKPVHLFQTSPDRIVFTQGADRIAVFSFGPRNILRWHASCCGSVLANTLRNPKIAFASIRTPLLSDQDAIGKVVTKAFMPNPGGKPKHKGMTPFVWRMFSQTVASRLSGHWRNTPFFNPETLEPVAPVTVVDPDRRREIMASLR